MSNIIVNELTKSNWNYFEQPAAEQLFAIPETYYEAKILIKLS